MDETVSHSSQEARHRLNRVLVLDRTDLSVQDFTALQDELLNVFSKYVQIEASALRLDLKIHGREQQLVAVFSLPPAQRRKSIQVD
jgi:cell division topological specificity factor MinE